MAAWSSCKCWSVFQFLWPTHIQNLPCNLNSTDVDHDPRKTAKNERKARIAKNGRQRLQNLAHTSGPLTDRKKEIDQALATTRISTASMGKFDRQLDGEKKSRGLKRKVSMMHSVTNFLSPNLFVSVWSNRSICWAGKEKCACVTIPHGEWHQEDGWRFINKWWRLGKCA